MVSRLLLPALLAVLAIQLDASARSQQSPAPHWGQWRGPLATGVAHDGNPPVEWSETTNVRWKVEVPGRGSGSPVVWGDRLYLLTAVPKGATGAASRAPRGGVSPRVPHDYKVLAYDRGTGALVWERTAREEIPHEASHQDNGTWASSSAITDGVHVVAYFESRGVHVYDVHGSKIWEKDLGDKQMRNEFGEGSTPVLFGNSLVIVWVIPSPVAGKGMVFLMSGFRGNNLKAIRLAGAKDDLTGSPAIRWELNRDTPYVPSPLLYDDILYVLKTNNGLLSAFDAESGKPHYQLQRLEKAPNVFSSPVGANGRVYIAGRDGTTVVLRHGPTFEVLAENALDDGFDASPAIVGRELFLRGSRFLYCIAAN